MHASSASPQSSAVVIACATADVDLIAEVGGRLRERGYTVELLGGAESDELSLVAAVQRIGRNGLYVLVRSDELGRAAVDALRAHVRRHEISFGRILTLTLEGVSSPSVLEERILSVLQRLSSWTKSSVLPTAAVAPPSPPPPPSKKAGAVRAPVETSDPGAGVDAWADSLAGRLISETLESEPSGTTAWTDANPSAATLDLEDEDEDEDEIGDSAEPASLEPASLEPAPPEPARQTALRPPIPPPLRPNGAPASPTKTLRPPAPVETKSVSPMVRAEAVAEAHAAAGVEPRAGARLEDGLADTLVADLLGDTKSTTTTHVRALLGEDEEETREGETAASLRATSAARGESSGGVELPAWLDESVVQSPPAAAMRRESNGSPREPEPTAAVPREPIAPTSAARPLVPRVEPTSPGLPSASENPTEASSTETFAGWGDAWTDKLREAGSRAKTLFKDAVPDSPRELLEPRWWADNRVVAASVAVALLVLSLGIAAVSSGEDDEGVSPPAVATASSDAPQVSSASAVPPPPVDPPMAETPAQTSLPAPTEAPAPSQPQQLPALTVDPKTVVAALESRRIRAMDTLLVTSDAKGSLDYGQAQQYCQSLQLEGLVGWRLPEIGELHSLSQAKILGKARYWSNTSGDAFGDRVMVLDGKRHESDPVSKKTSSIATVCVRPRS